MNLFKPKMLKWWQVSLLKISVACIGIVIGATWPAVFAPHTTILFIVGIGLGFYLLYIWAKK